ncbi:uncharacterized protein LOC136760267 [Amia ocellicauda]|uniref:uncharacterized protein LOC136760267 n=1 Tax=Amia ocellicauda TaxID=2972642 RepID=UPI003464B320
MSFVFCCCSCPAHSDETHVSEGPTERQPLLQPQSARQFGRAKEDGRKRRGRFLSKVTGVPELDRRFTDIADTFNRQQEQYEAMTACVSQLKESCQCKAANTLSDCLGKMKEDQGNYNIGIEMKGYDFSLVVQPDGFPAELQQAQAQVQILCKACKSTLAAGTKLQEMVNSVLQNQLDLLQAVKEAHQSHQEQVRLEANLQENLEETRRVQQLATQYRDEASALLREVALLAGIAL